MGWIASHDVQRLPFGCGSDPKTEPGAYEAFGLLIAYIMVIAFGIVANCSIEKFEAALNVAAIAGFTFLWAAVCLSSRRKVTAPDRGLRAPTVSSVNNPPLTTTAFSHSMDHWGPSPIIGSLNE